MSRSSAAKDKAARLAAMRHAPVVDPEAGEQSAPVAAPAPVEPPERLATPAPAPPAISGKPVRTTLDLAPALFDEFGEWRTRAARQLGRGRVTSADALRVLVRRVLDDDELSAAVVEDLRRSS